MVDDAVVFKLSGKRHRSKNLEIISFTITERCIS